MIKKVLGLGLAIIILATTTISSKASGLQKLDASSFKSDYRITSIHIGSDVYEISDYAFRNLNNLKSITVSENNPYFASYSNCLYDKEMTELVCFPPALSGAVIPASVVTIRQNALHGVADGIKEQVKTVIEAQASGYLKESEVPGAHFIHTDKGIRWKNADGSVESPSSSIMNLTGEVVNKSTTGSMTQQEQLEAAFYYLASNIYYARSTEEPTGDWVKEYAQNTLGDKLGNCYGYASAFAYVAKGLGYDAKVCTGTVKSSLGGRTAHAWTEVNVAGKWYVFDAEMQNAKGNGYYKQTYDSYPAGPLEKEKEYKVSF